MSDPVVLDDNLVLDQLRPVARDWAEPLDLATSRRAGRARLDKAMEDCRKLFRQHRGLAYHPSPSEDELTELQLFNVTLDILGLVLNLEGALPLLERVIEVDWRAHLDLQKEKRYRDHLTHPARVTAIGWWLLHRNEQDLLEDLAEHYRRATRDYRHTLGVDTLGHSWKAIIQFAWLASGLLHDSVYPAEYHLRAGAHLEACACDALGILAPPGSRLKRSAGRRRLLDPLAASWFSGQLLDLDSRLAALPKRGFKHAHALLGALHHLRALGARLHTLQGLVVQLAARAIATHHDQEETAIVSDPLALLLYVADSLQAWKRPFLHAEASEAIAQSHLVRPLVECERIALLPEGPGYLAEFWMNPLPVDMAILKCEPYAWRFEDFARPQQVLESRLRRHPALPAIILSEERCIQPPDFLDFMRP